MFFEAYKSLIELLPAQLEGPFGQQVGAKSNLWLALDTQGYPSLLVTTRLTDDRSDIELRSISVQFSRACEITTEEGENVAGTFTIVRLEENDTDLVRLFLRLLEEAFDGNNTQLTNRLIGERILEIAEIFRQIEISVKNVLGLWGELRLIKTATSRENAVRCWCQGRTAKYDFVCAGFAVEVKATLKPNRQHCFALEQLRPLDDSLKVFIASAQLVQSPGGKAVFELIDEIVTEIADRELRKNFLNACVLKGGTDIYKSNARYQFLSGDSAIAYYAAKDIPVPLVEPNGVISNLRFDVCLDTLPRQDVGVANEILNMCVSSRE